VASAGKQLHNRMQNKHVCIDAQAHGRVAKMKYVVNIVGVKVGVNLMPIKLINYNQKLEWG
jgi:3-deoxy-D-arabino-heptulosonate 7-phosphate (DAHP) synthase class II